MKDLALQQKWSEWLVTICDDVRSLVLSRKIFWEIQRIIDANAKLQKQPRLFNRWLAINYGVFATIGIRRQLDCDCRSVSLVRSLTELEIALHKRPDILSRANFVKTYYQSMQREKAEREYDALVGAGAQRLDATFVRCDLDRFRVAADTKAVRDFVNKRVAHWDEVAVPRVTFDEVDAALDMLVDLVEKYRRLLTGPGSSVEPAELSSDWKRIFTMPWVQPLR